MGNCFSDATTCRTTLGWGVCMVLAITGLILGSIAVATNRSPGPRGPKGELGSTGLRGATGPAGTSVHGEVAVPSHWIHCVGPATEKQTSISMTTHSVMSVIKYDGDVREPVKNGELLRNDARRDYNVDNGVWTVRATGFYELTASICFIWYTGNCTEDRFPSSNMLMDLRVDGLVREQLLFTVPPMSTYLPGGGDTKVFAVRLQLKQGEKVSLHLTPRSVSPQGILYHRPITFEVFGYGTEAAA